MLSKHNNIPVFLKPLVSLFIAFYEAISNRPEFKLEQIPIILLKQFPL